jgi:hypothetical protein
MNIGTAFPSQYLKAADLQGKEPAVTIERVEFEPVGQDKQMKPVLYFAGKEKGMVLNKTNAQTILTLTGTEETDDWGGFSVRLYSTKVQFEGRVVDSIRIKAAPRVAAPAPAKMAPVIQEADIDADSIPF